MPIKPSDVWQEDISYRVTVFCNYLDIKLRNGECVSDGKGYQVNFFNQVNSQVQDEVVRRYIAVGWKSVCFFENNDYNCVILTP